MLLRFAVYYAPLLCWMAVIFAGSSFSRESLEVILPRLLSGGPDGGAGLPFSDYLAHLSQFAVLSALTYWAFRSSGRLSRPALWGAVLVFTVLYGVSDEVHQSFVPGRSATAADVMIDAIGGVAGLIFAEGLLRVILRRRARQSRGKSDNADGPFRQEPAAR